MVSLARRRAAAKLRRLAHRLAPMSPPTWQDGEWRPTANESYAYIKLETDGIYTGTTLSINGQPVHNCIGFSFSIKTGGLARATVELDNVPIHFAAQLNQAAPVDPAAFALESTGSE